MSLSFGIWSESDKNQPPLKMRYSGACPHRLGGVKIDRKCRQGRSANRLLACTLTSLSDSDKRFVARILEQVTGTGGQVESVRVVL